MSTYLDEINEKMNLEQYNDWYIDNIFFDARSDFSHDSFISILKKYSIITYSYKNIKVEADDAQTILENYNASYNVLIRSVLDYLLSNSSLRSNSNLVSDCKECSILYFDNMIYKHEMVRTLAFINQTIFHYDVLQDELIYDWKTIQYSLNCENNKLILKLALENEYNERVEYIVECKSIF